MHHLNNHCPQGTLVSHGYCTGTPYSYGFQVFTSHNCSYTFSSCSPCLVHYAGDTTEILTCRAYAGYAKVLVLKLLFQIHLGILAVQPPDPLSASDPNPAVVYGNIDRTVS